MSATDELRKMLDERGVEWSAPTSFDGTARYDTNTSDYWFHEFNGKITIHGLTPAQAIAATLGVDAKPTQAESSRTCHRLPADNYDETCIVRSHGYEREFGYWKCSECGANCFEGARYCMNCGAKVVDE